MATGVVGSVTAQLILDSTDFVSGLETAKQQIKGLSGNISAGGLETFRKKISETNTETKKLKENLASLGKVQYGNPLKGWVEPIEEVVQGMEKVNKGLFQQQEKLRLLKDEWLSFKVGDNGLLSTKPMNTWLKDMEKANAETEKFSQKFIRLKEIMHYGGYNGSIVSQEAVKNMALLNKEMSATENWSKYLRNASVTMQDYYKNLNLVTQKMKEYEVTQQRLATKTSLGGMVNNVSGQIKQLRDSTGVSVSNRNAQLLSMEAEAVNRLKNAGLSANAELTKFAEAQARLGNSLTTTNPKFAEQISYLNRLKSSEDQASASATKLGSATQQASSKMNTLSGATTKLQSAMSSLKMMGTALSSMFVWTFGMSLYEATKQTLQSKNEMTSYLQQMGLGSGAINLFNKCLDETADRFKKLNKYMIGETIASIGMEFELNAVQMKKSMEVVAMIQNEYLRAGRKESEASLAVKDILQGEFLRLSRETGVGKQDLIDTGLWSGDLKDVEGLMDALKQVGESRHWDLFAEKCLSLNDVIQETKNRISEFGASLIDQFSPAIVNAFNMIIGVIDSVTSTWDNFDPTQKIIAGTAIIGAFGTALLMVAGNLTLMDIAQMGYTRSLLATLLHLDVATVKEYGLATALSAKITGLEASTVAETGNLRAIMARLLGVDASIVKEYGFLSALVASTTAEEASSVATQLNTLAKEGNVVATTTGTTVTKDFTVVKELATILEEENTVLTEANTIAKEMNNIANLGSFKSIVVLITGLKAEEVATMSTTEATWALITSLTVLEALAVVAIIAGIAIALGSLAMEAQRAKEAIDGFNDIVDNGDGYLEDAEKNVESLTEKISNLKNEISEAQAQGKDTWSMEQNLQGLEADLTVAKHNLDDIKNVNELAKKSAEDFQNQISNANTAFDRKNAEIFKKLGLSTEKASEEASQFTQQYLKGMDQMRIATKAYTDKLSEGSKHIDTNVDALKEAGAETDTLVQYTKDYGEEVLKNAEYQKEWAEGDFWAIFKIGLSDLKLAWIDFTYWVGQQQWYKDFCNALGEAGNALGEAGNALGELYNAIKPVIPVLADFAYFCGLELWYGFQVVCYGIYEAVKIVYPWIRKLAGISYDNIKQFVGYLQDTYDWLKKIWDFLNGDGKGLKQKLEDTFDIGLNPDDTGQIDWGKYFGNTANMGMDTFIGSNFQLRLLDMFVPLPDATAIGSRVDEWFGAIDESIMGLFSSDKIRNKTAMGTGNNGNFLDDLIHSLVGDDPFTTIKNAVDMTIATPFGQALMSSLSSIPIVGSIISLLGLTDGGEVQGTANQKGFNIGNFLGTGLTNMISSIPILGNVLSILGTIDSANPTAKQKGHNVGKNVHDGVDSGKAGTADLIRNEMGEIINTIANRVGEAYSTAQRVGSAILNGINSIIQHHSPGIPAKLVIAEMWEIGNAMDSAVDSIFASAQSVGNAITSGIQPNTDINFDAQAMAEYQANSMIAMGMADETVNTAESAFSQLDYSTMTTFGSIGTTIGTTMTNIASTTKMKYTDIANTTKLQLTNMQSQTTKNISAIRTSWTGMQTALINSAEHIRSETGAKIHSLQNNMATFWRKVQNPALLLGAGSPSEDRGRKVRYGSHGNNVKKVLSPKGFAGSPNIRKSNSNPVGARTGTGIMDKLPNRTVNGIKLYDVLSQYIECLQNGEPCYAGGWNFNWSKDIKDALLKWHTHFGQIYDPYLYVGKFENDTFPVRGIAPIAKNYIYDAISRTSYEYYMNSKYGSPLASWNAGHFNCYDGALLVMALARAFGFTNSTMVHGSWGGIPHVWARIAGLGDIDATAIQGGYGFTAPSRTGAGSPAMNKRFKHKGSSSEGNGNTINGDVNITINGVDKDSEEIGREVRNSIIDLFSPNPATGQ